MDRYIQDGLSLRDAPGLFFVIVNAVWCVTRGTNLARRPGVARLLRATSILLLAAWTLIALALAVFRRSLPEDTSTYLLMTLNLVAFAASIIYATTSFAYATRKRRQAPPPAHGPP